MTGRMNSERSANRLRFDGASLGGAASGTHGGSVKPSVLSPVEKRAGWPIGPRLRTTRTPVPSKGRPTPPSGTARSSKSILHDADQVITGYSEETVGRIRKDGGWDERYRTPRASHPDDATLAEFLWSLLTIGLCVGAVYAAGLVLSGMGVAR